MSDRETVRAAIWKLVADVVPLRRDCTRLSDEIFDLFVALSGDSTPSEALLEAGVPRRYTFMGSNPMIETPESAEREPVDVHTWFSLSYASYLTINRSLLQSMPLEWQHRFTSLLGELYEEFIDIEEPRYTVQCRDSTGRFIRDPIPNYNRGRTFVNGRTNEREYCG